MYYPGSSHPKVSFYFPNLPKLESQAQRIPWST